MDEYTKTANARTYLRRFAVTFAHGLRMSCEMDLSVSDLETLQRDGDITADVTCTVCRGHVTECPDVRDLLIEWPDRVFSTCW